MTITNMQERTTNNHIRRQRSQALYLACIVLSVVTSWGIFLQFLLSGEASVSAFFAQCFATPIATLLSSDVLLSAVIFLLFAYLELKRLEMPTQRVLLYAIATFSVGVCCGLSLFLYQRESWLAQK